MNGIVDREPRAAEIGKIKIGYNRGWKETPGGKKRPDPVKLDYFAIARTQNHADGTPIWDEEIMKEMDPKGGKPKRLKIFLLSDNPEDNFYNRYHFNWGGKLCCMGDGKRAMRRVINRGEGTVSWTFYPVSCDGKTLIKDGILSDESIDGGCNRETCQHAQSGECKPYGILFCLLRRAEGRVPSLGGVYKFRTKSSNSVDQIRWSLAQIHEELGGVLRGIPLELVLTTTIKTTKKGERHTVHIVHIEIDNSINMAAGAHLALADDISRRRKGHIKSITVNQNLLKQLQEQEMHATEQEQLEVSAEFSPDSTELKDGKPAQYMTNGGTEVHPGSPIVDVPQPTRAEVAEKEPEPKPEVKPEPEPKEESLPFDLEPEPEPEPEPSKKPVTVTNGHKKKEQDKSILGEIADDNSTDIFGD